MNDTPETPASTPAAPKPRTRRRSTRRAEPEQYDPHASTSYVLTEVRTVLNRARSAQVIIAEAIARDEKYRHNTEYSYLRAHSGEDINAIIAALETAVKVLEPWDRTNISGSGGKGGRSV